MKLLECHLQILSRLIQELLTGGLTHRGLDCTMVCVLLEYASYGSHMRRRVDLGPWLRRRQERTHRGPVSSYSGLLTEILTYLCSSSVETLINYGFEPERTIVLSFGFDEEVSGAQGATALSEYLLSKYGEDGFAMLIDEGGRST